MERMLAYREVDFVHLFVILYSKPFLWSNDENVFMRPQNTSAYTKQGFVSLFLINDFCTNQLINQISVLEQFIWPL